MNTRFESNNSDELEIALQHYNHFHDNYVAGIDIKFDNYRTFKEDGKSMIGDAEKTIILTMDTYYYGKKDKRYVCVEFQDVKTFEIISSEEPGPKWGVLGVYYDDRDTDIFWDFEPVCTGSRYIVLCDKIIFSD
ncbi:hypothetical protein JT359_14940 [Candidatus Poribacteria bacterium]|nr:hypothetical protein [Candidatus Poribacteria bacterium]